ncbi:Death domain-containing protein [Balamuthia mandrillaris]
MQLIVRECYPRIFELSQRLAKQRRGGGGGVVFSGNPGIGKSWFLNYTLWRLLQQKKTVLVESVAREKVWLFKEGQVQEASLENTKQIVELFQTVENDTDAWYLFDPCGDIPREPKQMLPFTVVAASPNPQHYKQFYKRTRNKYYTPCWPWEELKKLCVKQPKRWPQVNCVLDLCCFALAIVEC